MNSVTGLGLSLAVACLLAAMSGFATPAAAADSSPGCTAVNAGDLDVSISNGGQNSITVLDLVEGDELTFSITMTSTVNNDQWWIHNASNLLLDGRSNTATDTVVYTVTSSDGGSISSVVRIQNPGTSTVTATATCSPGPYMSTTTDSDRLDDVQSVGTRIVAATSGAAIGDATAAGTEAAFSGAAPFSAGPNGVTLNFAASSRQRDAAARARDAFSALGFAGDGSAAPAPDQRLNVWANVRGSWLTNDIDGHQINATLGIGYKLTPDLVLGAFAGYETFDYTFNTLVGNLDGSGVTIGIYAGWRLMPALRLDGLVGWSGISYDATAGAARGSFDASRWIASAGLSGAHRYSGFTLAPSAKVFVLWENQDGYTDSLGGVHAARDVYTGRASLGGRISKAFQVSEGTILNPYLEAYGDAHFSDGDAVNTVDTGYVDGLSGRTGAGIALTTTNGVSVSLGGEVAGLGQNVQVWSASGRLAIPF
ncbi:autotransporter outer membrane beta-barrel domain-containing protein [Breoghania sp. L-A4]|uniref:autotransporter outer membrane beta-barrel domain-containing protein n=1 Tax=Breoghania sp. L-A4 TaxID=2304600 RepID=UPI000E35C351|nr:autotransporter outer membrane beta-barrel domain-containing protein [Breoghania sp. L-A4]AXS40663.1 autotransporter outer membrane beta-barrel domain-containing protein [Breoghania sp. L-A4]